MTRPTSVVLLQLCLSAFLAGCDGTSNTIEDLGTLGGTSVALGINSGGSVTGASYLTPDGHLELHAFRYVDGFGMLDLGALPGGDISEGRGINSLGQVCGASSAAGSVTHAFFVTSTLDMVDLGTLGGEFSSGWDINDRAQVTGEAERADGRSHAFVWSSSTGMQDIGTLGGTGSVGFSINAGGQVAGESRVRGGAVTHAFLHTDGEGMIDLGTLTGGSTSAAFGINDRGYVVGESATRLVFRGLFARPGISLFGDGTHAFLWTESDGMSDLGTLGGEDSSAKAINTDGVVVGTGQALDGTFRAFRWTQAEGMTDLNTLLPDNSGWVLFEAWDINDSGQIVGTGNFGGKLRAFRFNPATPESEGT